ncbi:hypothetical protein LCGC14_1530790 [marine sediment metagenome]|uniref:OmpR/PhoB-type domain-containing protein n=1 Tax=marine sediment metagenome TaxID=412755 RepID=A0A0F9JGS0_9ZZZZ
MSELCPTCGGAMPESSSVILNRDTGVLVGNKEIVILNGLQLRIMSALIDCYPRVATREFILSRMYDHFIDEPELKIVDVYICKLRKATRGIEISIITNWGRGYSLFYDKDIKE